MYTFLRQYNGLNLTRKFQIQKVCELFPHTLQNFQIFYFMIHYAKTQLHENIHTDCDEYCIVNILLKLNNIQLKMTNSL